MSLTGFGFRGFLHHWHRHFGGGFFVTLSITDESCGEIHPRGD